MKKTRILGIILAAVLLLALPSGSVFAVEIDDHVMLVNGDHPVSQTYKPISMMELSNDIPSSKSIQMDTTAAKNLLQMYREMRSQTGYYLQLDSGFRSYDYQSMLFNNCVNSYMADGYSYQYSYDMTKEVIARPGTSEHQTGLAIDVSNNGSLDEYFASTSVGKWLAANSHKYGFILRYKAEKKQYTKIISEPWHFRFVGLPHSQIMYEKNWCMEEYHSYLWNNGSITMDSGDYRYTVYYRKDTNTADLKGVQAISRDGAGGYIVTCKNYIPSVRGTDIHTVVNGGEMPTFQYYGDTRYPVIIAEDLQCYGFDVSWNAQDKTVVVQNNPDKPIRPIPMDYYRQFKPGQKVYAVYPSDIKVVLVLEDGTRRVMQTAVSLRGYMAISADELAADWPAWWEGVTQTIFIATR